MCVMANKAYEVSEGKVDYKVRREVYDLSSINILIQSRSISGGKSVIYVMNKNTLNGTEFNTYRTNLINRLKEGGYILKRVKHPDTDKFILDISWDLGGGLPSGV